jgi:hypothetical protein
MGTKINPANLQPLQPFLLLNMTANNPPKGSGPVLEWWDFVSTILYR